MSMNTKRDPIVLERRFVPKGSLIITQGDEGNCAFLIQSGSVSIFTVKSDGHQIELAQIEAGNIFGEMALLFDGPRTASARALEDCNLIVITRQVFDNKLEKSDPTIRAMLTMLTERIIKSNNSLINKKNSLEDLTNTTRMIYDNALQTLSREQQRSLENAVLPKLEAFLGAVKSFHERFAEDDARKK